MSRHSLRGDSRNVLINNGDRKAHKFSRWFSSTKVHFSFGITGNLVSLCHKLVNEVNTMDNELYQEKEVLWDLHFGDGLLWIYKGLIFLLIAPAVRYSLALYLLIIPLYLSYKFIKKKWVLPRRGMARPRLITRPRNLFFGSIWGMIAAILMVGGGMYLTSIDDAGIWWLVWILACITLLVASWLVTALNYWDGKHPYHVLERIVVLILLSCLLWIEPDYNIVSLGLGAYGLFNLIIGLVQFIGFIRKNPVMLNEE